MYSKTYIQKIKPDLVHYTYYSNNLANKIPKIFTVYDMTVEKYPELFLDSAKQTNVKRISCENADHIISISNSTKQDLIEFFGIESEKISVIHLGVDYTSPSNTKLITERPYILYVGTRYKYKKILIHYSTLIQEWTQKRNLT